MGAIKEVNEKQWEAEVVKSDKPVLVDFWAPWCGPCNMLAPTVEKLSETHDAKIKVVKLNTDENPGIAQKFGIRSIPTLILLNSGEELDRYIGLQPYEVLEQNVLSHL